MKRWIRAFFVILLVAILAIAAHRPILTATARYLIAQDPLGPADVIVVLSGGFGDERVRQAADLYHQRLAPIVLLSGGEEMVGISIPELQRRQALGHGVPESALRVEPGSTSTADQARFLRPMLEGMGVRRALVVTSSFHTRRTRYLFRRTFHSSPVEIRVYPVQQDVFQLSDWWTRDWETEQVVLEYIKLALAVLRYR